MPYTQTVFALDGAAVPTQAPAFAAACPVGDWVATQRHTFTPSGRRLPGDLWDEYRCECATRNRLHLPEVNPTEFRDLRDWTDGCKENDDDDDWITEPDTDALPYGCIHL